MTRNEMSKVLKAEIKFQYFCFKKMCWHIILCHIYIVLSFSSLRMTDCRGTIAGLRRCGAQLFSVKHAVCCCVYLNSQE